MKQNLIIGFIGKDKPGLVHSIADVVNAQGGNWLESRMSQLANRFAGIAVVEVDAANIAAANIAAAPMSGEATFSADVAIEVPDAIDSSVIGEQLDEITDQLGVHILLIDPAVE